MPYTTVIFDFYGTLAIRNGQAEPLQSILARFGHSVADELIWEYFNDGIDGIDHSEHSSSRDKYMAWQDQRLRDWFGAAEIPEEDHDLLNEALTASWDSGFMEPYPETAAVLAELSRNGKRLIICSNWDWDLREAVNGTGLADHFDAMLSSAWVGVRKPHPKIFEEVLRLSGTTSADTLFVGDTWNCDIEGPKGCGMTPVYVRRAGREADHTRPPGAETDHVFADLTGLLQL